MYSQSHFPSDLRLPNANEVKAHNLRTRQGLSDADIARIMSVRRETANRYANGFTRCVDRIRDFCAGCGDCNLVDALNKMASSN